MRRHLSLSQLSNWPGEIDHARTNIEVGTSRLSSTIDRSRGAKFLGALQRSLLDVSVEVSPVVFSDLRSQSRVYLVVAHLSHFVSFLMLNMKNKY